MTNTHSPAAAAHAASQRSASEPAAPLATASRQERRGPAATASGFRHRAAPRPVSHTGPDSPAQRPASEPSRDHPPGRGEAGGLPLPPVNLVPHRMECSKAGGAPLSHAGVRPPRPVRVEGNLPHNDRDTTAAVSVDCRPWLRSIRGHHPRALSMCSSAQHTPMSTWPSTDSCILGAMHRL
jgi:hypothetical protein